MSRPECRGEGAERRGEAVACPGVDSGETTRAPGAPILEQALIDRVEAVQKVAEDMAAWIGRFGYPAVADAFRARLRDLTEEEPCEK